jgi:hypothetical protein
MEPRDQFQGMNSASLSVQAGLYDNPIPTWFLAPTDLLKIPALYSVEKQVEENQFSVKKETHR